MKAKYTSQELRRIPGVTYDTLRTWAGRRNDDRDRSSDKHQPVLLTPIHKPGSTSCWIYDSNAVEKIWWIRMLQMLGYKNREIEEILDSSIRDPSKEIWNSLNDKINDLRWKIQHLSIAQRFAETIRSVGKLPSFPHKDGIDDIDQYLEILSVNPKIGSFDYESGSSELLKAHDLNKDAVIAKANTPELVDLRDEIYHSIRELWILHVQACSSQVYPLVETLYVKSFKDLGYDLNVFHSYGTILAKHEDLAQRLDNSYDNGFSAYLAEAIFIYCFIQSLLSNEEEQSTAKN